VRPPSSSLDSGRSRRLRLWLPVVVYAVAIFFVSSMSTAPLPPGVSDKSGHGAAYAGFGLVVLRALAGASVTGVTVAASVAAVAIATAYGASDELHQLFVRGRTADLHDLAADASGAAAGVAVAWLGAAIIRSRKSRI
jgi:VanZ family protein